MKGGQTNIVHQSPINPSTHQGTHQCYRLSDFPTRQSGRQVARQSLNTFSDSHPLHISDRSPLADERLNRIKFQHPSAFLVTFQKMTHVDDLQDMSNLLRGIDGKSINQRDRLHSPKNQPVESRNVQEQAGHSNQARRSPLNSGGPSASDQRFISYPVERVNIKVKDLTGAANISPHRGANPIKKQSSRDSAARVLSHRRQDIENLSSQSLTLLGRNLGVSELEGLPEGGESSADHPRGTKEKILGLS